MKAKLFFLCLIGAHLLSPNFPAADQRADPFPVLSDFPEIQRVISQTSFRDVEKLKTIPGGRLIADQGFEEYATRSYWAGDAGELSIAVATLVDFLGAYSLLTLNSSTEVTDGPPGDCFVTDGKGIQFFQDKYWVVVRAPHAPERLVRKIALAVSQRLGGLGRKKPSLVEHLPAFGFDPSTVKYFPGVKPFRTFYGAQAIGFFHLDADAEIAQARYAVGSQAGTLTLLNFPTPELGEEYFIGFSSRPSYQNDTEDIYFKRAGPLVAVLKGRISAETADAILASLRHRYAIQWIYEKSAKKMSWGIPVRLLHTVAKSIVFVVLLCLVAIFGGAGFAVVRYVRRRNASRKASDWLGQTDSTRLR